MNRDIFIKQINQMYNDSINSVSKKGIYHLLFEVWKEEMIKGNYSTMREFLLTQNPVYLRYEVDISTINRITNNNKINPFLKLYSLDINTLEDIYILLSKTHNAIDYYDRYSSKNRKLKEENKTTKGNNTKTNKINDVIKMILETDIEVEEYINKINLGEKIINEDKPYGYKTLVYLEGLVKSLDNLHFTKLQLYQNLLYELYFILKDKFYIDERTNKEIKYSKNTIFDIADKLIKYYFCENDTQIIENEKEKIFSTSINFDKYITKEYIYETMAGITLTHSKKGMEF